MRLRDPISSYKCFEAIATPSPIGLISLPPPPQSDGNHLVSSRHSTLRRTASLDSLANSSGQESVSSDEPQSDDVDDELSDADSISGFEPVRSTEAQVHRKSDLEQLKNEPVPKEPVIKAYLEKSHRKCDYKNCGFKKKDHKHDRDEMGDSDEVLMVSTQMIEEEPICPLPGSAAATYGTTSSSKTRRASVVSSGSMGRMETIIEEPLEPKISVKEILARFETLNTLEVCFVGV